MIGKKQAFCLRKIFALVILRLDTFPRDELLMFCLKSVQFSFYLNSLHTIYPNNTNK